MTRNSIDLTFESQGPEETQGLAEKILHACKNRRIFAIYGELGAGKTTLVQSFCEVLGVLDTVKSPTFSIVNEYESEAGGIYHFDFYRIEEIEEVFDLGFDEYLDSGNYIFMEWPERIQHLIPEEAVSIQISVTDTTFRKIAITL